VGAETEVGRHASEVLQRGAHHGRAQVLARGVEELRLFGAGRLEAIEGHAAQFGIDQIAHGDGAAGLGHVPVEDHGELVRGADVALHVELGGEQSAGGADDGGGGAQFAGAGGQGAFDVPLQHHGLVGDLFLKRAQAQGAVEAARHRQLAGRAGSHGQADQAGVASAVARLGDGGLETKAGAQVGQVEGVGDGGGDGAGLFRGDAGAAHGLFKGFAATDLDGNGLRGGHAGRSIGGGEGLNLHGGHLGRGGDGNFFCPGGLIDSAGQKRHRDRGGGGQSVRGEAHRLSARVELSHRSRRAATPEASNHSHQTAPHS